MKREMDLQVHVHILCVKPWLPCQGLNQNLKKITVGYLMLPTMALSKQFTIWNSSQMNEQKSGLDGWITRKSQLPTTAKLSTRMGAGRDADESMNKSS